MRAFQRLLWLLLILTSVRGWAQGSSSTYTVIKVSGKVMSSLFKREVKAGDVVKASDKLTFESRNSYVHIINPDGRKTIRNVPDNSPRELMQLLQTFLSPDKKNRASRGMSQGFDRITEQLSFDTLLILGKGRIAIDTTEISMKKPAGIKASYSSKTEKVVRIISEGAGFNLGKEYLFAEGTTRPFPRVLVSYYENMADPDFNPSELLGYFVPLYVDEGNLQMEIKAIIDALKATGMASSKITAECLTYLTTEYATPISQNVKDWIAANKLMP